MSEQSIDFDGLMQANLARVFNEADSKARRAAIRDLYTPDAVFYEPDAVASGEAAIAKAVDALLASLPPGFVFAALGPAVGHHGLGRLRWSCGPRDGPAAVTGTDVARIEGGRIESLYVFIDPGPA